MERLPLAFHVMKLLARTPGFCAYARRMARRLPGTENEIRVTRTTAYPLERVAVPTLVVHGTSDKLVPFDQHGRALAARIPGVRLLAVEGGEHVSIFTHRREVRATVTAFLREHAPRREARQAEG